MPPTDDDNERERLLERMEEALDTGFDAANWRDVLRDLAVRADAADMLRQAHRTADACDGLRRVFDEAPVPSGLADGIKASLSNAWGNRSGPKGMRRLTIDELDLVAAAGQFPLQDDPEDGSS